ncbi:unnamed protein product [Calicophoron daubneyi]
MQAAVLQKEQCIQHTETIRTQKSKIEKLSTQLDQMKSEMKKLQRKLTDQQAATAEARVEADRRASLISTLAAESTNKDAMLRQLDSTLGRLTDGWQKREAQRNTDLTEAEERERRLRDELDTVKKQLEDTQKSWEEEVKNLRNELQTATLTAQEELARRNAAVNSLEMKASKLADRVGELKRTVERREAETEEYRKQVEQSKRDTDELRSQCIQLKTTWQQQINDARDALRREARFRRHELKKLQAEMQKAAETNEREKDELRQLLNKEYEQHLHDVLVGKDKEFQKQLMNVQENAQIALRDASDRYRMELEQLRLNAQNELAKHLNDAENRIDSERRRLTVVEKQMERWRAGAREAEEARSILVHRLNELLQSRCSEAIRLLHPQMTDKTKNMSKESESAQSDENRRQKPLKLHHPMNVDELAELFTQAQPLPQAPLLLTNISMTNQSNASQSEDETSSVTTESAVTQILNYQCEPQVYLAPTALDSAPTELKVNNPVNQIPVIADLETEAAK